MKMRIVISFLAAIATLGSFAWADPPRERLVTEADYNIDVKYMLKGGSLTKDYDLSVSSNGMVTVVNKDYYTNERVTSVVRSGQLSPEELADLKRLILEINVFRFNDEYISEPHNQLGWRGEELYVTVNGKTKKILLSAASFPVELGQLIRRITEIKDRINNA
ncbi:MAG: hypothetical protein ABH865_08180 [Candidatus Omnitrophota bacterium]|nr:hypothetical protein [Candidatus Omnitrophota bacterium]